MNERIQVEFKNGPSRIRGWQPFKFLLGQFLVLCPIPLDTRRLFNVYKTSIQRHRHRLDVL